MEEGRSRTVDGWDEIGIKVGSGRLRMQGEDQEGRGNIEREGMGLGKRRRVWNGKGWGSRDKG